MKFKTLLPIALVSAFSSLALGEELSATDDFSEATLSSSWAAAKGTWKIDDGMLSGAELTEDKHAAVLTYKAPHTDSKIEFDFKLNGSKGFALSYNHAKGHLFRVNVTGAGASLQLDKDKKDPASKAMKLAEGEGAFEAGKVYHIVCTTAGETATVEFSNGIKLSGTHAALAKGKTGYRFIVKGDGVLFDNVEVDVEK